MQQCMSSMSIDEKSFSFEKEEPTIFNSSNAIDIQDPVGITLKFEDQRKGRSPKLRQKDWSKVLQNNDSKKLGSILDHNLRMESNNFEIVNNTINNSPTKLRQYLNSIDRPKPDSKNTETSKVEIDGSSKNDDIKYDFEEEEEATDLEVCETMLKRIFDQIDLLKQVDGDQKAYNWIYTEFKNKLAMEDSSKRMKYMIDLDIKLMKETANRSLEMMMAIKSNRNGILDILKNELGQMISIKKLNIKPINFCAESG